MQETQGSHSDSVGCRQKNNVMDNLKDSVLSRLAAMNPSVSINSFHASFVQQRLQQIFNSFHAPTHPPYALMIERAITELNEESGSTEEAISGFIRREYDGLPLAHSRILDLHLRRLCNDGVIVRTNKGKYRPKKRRGRGRKQRTTVLKRCEGGSLNGMRCQESEETKEQSAFQGEGEVHWKPLLVAVEHEQQTQSQFQGTRVTEEHSSEAEGQQIQETPRECTLHVFQRQEKSTLAD